MARASFGGGASDFLFSQTAGGLVRVGSGTLTLWDSEVGGTRYTDLVVGGSPAGSVAVGADGQIPSFQGPDEVYEMWADAGGGRVQLEATADRVESAAAAAEAARDQIMTVGGVNSTYSLMVYDGNGNLTSWVENGVSCSATYDPVTGNMLTLTTGTITRTFSYDAEGNMTGAV